MRLLLLGYSDIARRRVLPAAELIDDIRAVEIASKSSEGMSDSETFTKVKKSYRDYREAISSSECDTVYVSLTNDLHSEYIETALLADKHVIVDKPATLSPEDSARLGAIATARSLLLAEALVYPFHPISSAITAAFRELGDSPKRITALFSMTLGKPGNYRWESARGGGCLWDIGPYAVSLGRIFLGQSPALVQGAILARNGVAGVDVAFSSGFTYSDGRHVAATCGWDTAYRNEIHLLGERMSVSAERVFSAMPNLTSEIVIRVDEGSGSKVIRQGVPAGDSFRLFLEAVSGSIMSGELASWREGLVTDSRVLWQLRESCK